jgi:predicted Zn-dependent protease
MRRQGRFAEAIPQLRKAIQLDPGNISYSRNLADFLLAGRRYGEYEVEQRRKIGMLPEQFKEVVALAESSFESRGSTAEADAYLAQLPPEQANSAEGINIRKHWAQTKGDWAEAIRLDKLQPYYDGDGTRHFAQAFFSAMTYLRAGDLQSARERADGFPQELRDRLSKEPENVNIMLFLSSYESLAGHNDEAIRLARKAVDTLPESVDAIDGPLCEYVLAAAYANAGDKDRALQLLAHLAHVPYGRFNVHVLRTDGDFALLSDDPRFQAMLADPANNAPLF